MIIANKPNGLEGSTIPVPVAIMHPNYPKLWPCQIMTDSLWYPQNLPINQPSIQPTNRPSQSPTHQPINEINKHVPWQEMADKTTPHTHHTTWLHLGFEHRLNHPYNGGQQNGWQTVNPQSTHGHLWNPIIWCSSGSWLTNHKMDHLYSRSLLWENDGKKNPYVRWLEGKWILVKTLVPCLVFTSPKKSQNS